MEVKRSRGVRRGGQFQRKGRKPCREMAEKRSFTELLEVGTEYASATEGSGGQILPGHGRAMPRLQGLEGPGLATATLLTSINVGLENLIPALALRF